MRQVCILNAHRLTVLAFSPLLSAADPTKGGPLKYVHSCVRAGVEVVPQNSPATHMVVH